jgi:hypothetical protein
MEGEDTQRVRAARCRWRSAAPRLLSLSTAGFQRYARLRTRRSLPRCWPSTGLDKRVKPRKSSPLQLVVIRSSDFSNLQSRPSWGPAALVNVGKPRTTLLSLPRTRRHVSESSGTFPALRVRLGPAGHAFTEAGCDIADAPPPHAQRIAHSSISTMHEALPVPWLFSFLYLPLLHGSSSRCSET